MWNAFIEAMKWIRESVRPVYVILVLSGVCLLPCAWLTKIGMADWTRAHHPVIVLTFMGAVVWLSSFPIESQYYHHKRKAYLTQLTDEEKDVLKPFILNKKKTQSFAMNLAIARHLAEQHILTETSTLSARGHHVFVMNRWVFSHLLKHSAMVGIREISN